MSNPNHAGNTVETFYLEQPEFSDNQNITGFHMCRTCVCLVYISFAVVGHQSCQFVSQLWLKLVHVVV